MDFIGRVACKVCDHVSDLVVAGLSAELPIHRYQIMVSDGRKGKFLCSTECAQAPVSLLIIRNTEDELGAENSVSESACMAVRCRIYIEVAETVFAALRVASSVLGVGKGLGGVVVDLVASAAREVRAFSGHGVGTVGAVHVVVLHVALRVE